MGLDMYAFSVSKADAGDFETDLPKDDDQQVNQFFYWRKFNALHGWMQNLYYSKGGEKESFNCTTVRLDAEDLNRLLKEANSLKPVSGFFFGDQTIYPEDRESIDTFVNMALAEIADGKVVYYDSWW